MPSHPGLRKVSIGDIPVKDQSNAIIQVEVSYNSNRKEYILYATYGTVKREDGYTMFTCEPFSDCFHTKLENANRFSAKRLAQLAASIKTTPEYTALIARVCEAKKIQV